MTMKVTEKYLYKVFHTCNVNFFYNRLQRPVIKIVKKMPGKKSADGAQRFKDKMPEIYIPKDMQHLPVYCAICLIHEMVHQYLRMDREGGRYIGDHGARFGAEICRLFNEGAYDDLL